MHELLIIGGGPAGLTAAMYAIHKRIDMMVIARELGGKARYHLRLPFIEQHRVISGDDLIYRFMREIEYLEYAKMSQTVTGIQKIKDGFEVALENGEKINSQALLIATGAQSQPLNVPGEQEYFNRGLCNSAISYAQFFIDRTAAVIGEDDLALRAVADLARHCSEVTLIAPSEGILSNPMARWLESLPNVRFMLGYDVTEIGGDGTYARSVVITREDEVRDLKVDAIFVEHDLIPRSALVAHLCELDNKGRIKINSRNETSLPGIFAAGDVTDGYAEQALIGIGEGAKAALSAYEYLLGLKTSAVADLA